MICLKIVLRKSYYNTNSVAYPYTNLMGTSQRTLSYTFRKIYYTNGTILYWKVESYWWNSRFVNYGWLLLEGSFIVLLYVSKMRCFICLVWDYMWTQSRAFILVLTSPLKLLVSIIKRKHYYNIYSVCAAPCMDCTSQLQVLLTVRTNDIYKRTLYFVLWCSDIIQLTSCVYNIALFHLSCCCGAHH